MGAFEAVLGPCASLTGLRVGRRDVGIDRWRPRPNRPARLSAVICGPRLRAVGSVFWPWSSWTKRGLEVAPWPLAPPVANGPGTGAAAPPGAADASGFGRWALARASWCAGREPGVGLCWPGPGGRLAMGPAGPVCGPGGGVRRQLSRRRPPLGLAPPWTLGPAGTVRAGWATGGRADGRTGDYRRRCDRRRRCTESPGVGRSQIAGSAALAEDSG